MIQFRICGIKITAEFSFFVFTAMIFLCTENSLISDYLASAFIHECAHGIALCLSGGSLCGILFTACGIRLIPKKEHILSYGKELFVLFAGPLSNLLLFLVFHASEHTSQLALINLGIALFNLLPYSLLDGGCAVIALSRIFDCESKIRLLLTIIHILFFVLSLFCTIIYGLTFLPLAIFTLSYGIYDLKQK